MRLLLDVFEGPLDLLLFLIKRNNLEISRISIARVAGQYLEYLETMREIDVDVASDFLVMAAELAHMKSKALLPQKERGEDEEDDEDSTDLLLHKLRVYEKFKTLSQGLSQRALFGRDIFGKGHIDFSSASFSDDETDAENEESKEKKPEPTEYNVTSFDLMRAFHEILKRVPQSERQHHVSSERVSVTERIYELLNIFDDKDTVLFTELFSKEAAKIDCIVTFLALLEMSKLNLAKVYQTDVFAPIRIKKSEGANGFRDEKAKLAAQVDF